MILYDLHTHSTGSDGCLTPAELVGAAVKNGVSALALTDHDTVSGCAAAAAEAARLGLRFVPGVEISAKAAFKLHILGLGIDYNDAALNDVLRRCAESRTERTFGICRSLAGFGVELDPVKINASAKNVGKPHIALELVARGYAGSVREAFDRWLDLPEVKQHKKYKVTFAEAAELIHGAGGRVVLAHPYQTKLDDAELEQTVREFSEQGLDGIECFYSRHTPEMAAFYLSLAEKYGLAVSCGSDYHGAAVKPDIEVGTGADGSLLRLRERFPLEEERSILGRLR